MSPSAMTPSVTPRNETSLSPFAKSTSMRSSGAVRGEEEEAQPRATLRAEAEGPRLFRPSRGWPRYLQGRKNIKEQMKLI